MTPTEIRNRLTGWIRGEPAMLRAATWPDLLDQVRAATGVVADDETLLDALKGVGYPPEQRGHAAGDVHWIIPTPGTRGA